MPGALRLRSPLPAPLLTCLSRVASDVFEIVSETEPGHGWLTGTHDGFAEGIFPAPEGAATLVGLKRLLEQKFLDPDESVVLFNTGSGYKYLDLISGP